MLAGCAQAMQVVHYIEFWCITAFAGGCLIVNLLGVVVHVVEKR
jgi:hypothetical protein